MSLTRWRPLGAKSQCVTIATSSTRPKPISIPLEPLKIAKTELQMISGHHRFVSIAHRLIGDRIRLPKVQIVTYHDFLNIGDVLRIFRDLPRLGFNHDTLLFDCLVRKKKGEKTPYKHICLLVSANETSDMFKPIHWTNSRRLNVNQPQGLINWVKSLEICQLCGCYKW